MASMTKLQKAKGKLLIGQVFFATLVMATPLIADADTGYGGLLNVAHTVRGYVKAGAAALQFEDQEFPKKCGHTPNRRVTSLDDMLRKIEVAVDSRRSNDFLIAWATHLSGARTEEDLQNLGSFGGHQKLVQTLTL